MRGKTASCFILISVACIFFSNCGRNSSATRERDVLPDNTMTSDTELQVKHEDYDVVGASEGKQKLVKKYNSLLVFHADDTMEVNKVYLATLALARDANIEQLTAKVLEASDAASNNVITDTTIEIGKRMKARLLDLSPRQDRSFEITALSPDEQDLVSKSKEAYWQWNVEPLKEGNHQLKLTVAVTLADDESYGLPARDIPVIIFAKKASLSTRVGHFFSNYWQWVITGICVPIIVAWFTTWFRYRAEQRNKKRQV